MYGARLVETTELNGVAITPATVASNFTDAIDLSRCRRWEGIVTIPTLSGGATVDAGFYGCATSGGSYVAITGAKITTESVGGVVYRIEITTDAVTNFNSTYKWMKGYLQCKVASAGNVSMVVIGDVLRFEPATDQSSEAGTPVIAPGV